MTDDAAGSPGRSGPDALAGALLRHERHPVVFLWSPATRTCRWWTRSAAAMSPWCTLGMRPVPGTWPRAGPGPRAGRASTWSPPGPG